jgi:hypothetical protein
VSVVVIIARSYCVTCCSKRFQSLTGQESFGGASNGSSTLPAGVGQSSASSGGRVVTMGDLESLRHEILGEMRAELQKIKQEIVEGSNFYLSICLCPWSSVIKILLLFTENTVNVKHKGCVLCCSCEERTYSTITIAF